MGFKYWSASCLLGLFLVSPAHADLAPEEILRNAALYTVKVKTLGDIGLNKDEGGSSTGTGFLIDRKRGWILTNAHVATRSPAKIEVSFKDGASIAAKRIHVDAYIDMAVLLDQIPSIQVKYDNGPKDAGPASGEGYVFFIADGVSMERLTAEVSALKAALDKDLQSLSPR